MATNPDDLFADLLPNSGSSGPRYGPAPKPSTTQTRATWRTLSSDEAKAAGLSPTKVWQANSDGETKAIGDANPADAITDTDKASLRNEALSKVRLGLSLIKRSQEGWFTTGVGSGIASQFNGTPAMGVKEDTETLKNAGALQKILELNAKTGKNPLTPLSNSDFQALQNSITNINTGQPDEQYQRNVGTMLDIYRRAYVAAGGNERDISDLYSQYGVGSDAGKPRDFGGGDKGPPGSGELSAAQQQAYKAWIGANPNPTPDQLTSFLHGLGVEGEITNAPDIIKAVKEGRGVSSATRNLTAEQQAHEKALHMKATGGGAGSAGVAGLGEGGSLGAIDELGAGIQGAAEALGGQGSLGDRYDINLAANREYLHGLQDEHPYAYGGGALVGGLATAPLGGEINSVGQAAKVGGALGSVYGFNSGEGAEGRIGGAIVGGATGAGLGAGLSALAPYGARALPRGLGGTPRGMAPDVAAAAQAEGVDLIRPMVDPKSLSDFGALESNRFSQPTIRAGVERTRGQIADRAAALGGDGTALETDAAGGLVQKAGERFIQRTKGVKDRLYNRAESLAGDTRFVPQQALNQLDADIASLQGGKNTNSGLIDFLQGVREDLAAPGGKTVAEIRNIREGLRGKIAQGNLTMSNADRLANNALHAANDDIAQAAPQAASAYRRADAYYRERQTHIDDIVKRITGSPVGDGNFQVSGEQAFQRLKSMASPGGDGRRLAALMRDLEPNERQDIAATIAGQLGRDAPDAPFSAAKFLSQTNKLSPSARRTIFGPDGAQSIGNLRTLSQALKDAGQDINSSKSATVLERSAWRTAAHTMLSTLTGLGGYEAGGIAGGLTAVAAGTGVMAGAGVKRVLSARAMVNPRVSRWLAETADVATQRQAANQVRKLGVIISREPALAAELSPIRDMLQQRVTPQLAAQPAAEGGNNEQP